MSPLKKQLEKQLDIPVFVENDCNIAALGVYVAELKSKPSSMVGFSSARASAAG